MTEAGKPTAPLSALHEKTRVLVVEDEALFARAVVRHLQKSGYDCEHAETLTDSRPLARQFNPAVVLLDMRLPDGNGLDLLAELVARDAAVIVMTAYSEISDAVHAIRQGAVDYLKKPVDLDELLLVIQKAEAGMRLRDRLGRAQQRDSRAVEGAELLGDSPAMQELRQQLERIAQLSATADAPTVLISGETGTGKDVAARLLHACSPRHEQPFVHLDCASLPAELIESELFGHEKGAYTSAQEPRCGLIEAAEDGTLFLDEIGELPPALQAKLLNVLERRVVRRLGSNRERPVAARFIAASNRDLQQMVLDGRFRPDLFYRLNVLTLTLPPLRERGDDVLLLARHFAVQTARRYGLPQRPFSDDALRALGQYTWPGNVRELRHQVSRAVLMGSGTQISAADLALPGGLPPPLMAPSGLSAAQDITLQSAERMLIENALRQSHHNVSEAARRLDITRMAMRYRMEKYGIKS